VVAASDKVDVEVVASEDVAALEVDVAPAPSALLISARASVKSVRPLPNAADDPVLPEELPPWSEVRNDRAEELNWLEGVEEAGGGGRDDGWLAEAEPAPDSLDEPVAEPAPVALLVPSD